MASPGALAAFFEESDSHLEIIESSLLILEKDSSNMDVINEVFRAVHSLKGNAGLVGFGDIHDIATKMENLMDTIRKAKKPVEPKQRDELFDFLDKVKTLIGVQKPSAEEKGGEVAPAAEQAPVPETERREKPREAKTPAKGKKLKASEEEKIKTTQKFLTFMLGNEEYGLDINVVREIILRRHITRVPHSKPFVTGIMNLRGLVIPVIDAKKRLKFKNADEDTAGNIIVVEEDGVPTGVLVDIVKDIVNLDDADIVASEKAFGKTGSDCLSGIGKLEKKSIMLLDITTFCSSKEEYF